ncbi:hypothetical protein DSM106972_088040 [Dulcicalothrix desertica PCC 7102]|uniref:Uncharacterized protein n=1 Tax=Dulcicalothrix desertica PCC 7102 TaxID=232991 RepID=A0A3S1C6L6_9CYAN|nr:DUF4198 domain-containing protein [Dulcicalothrix desertica]RUS96262.1 hypothetical protein DSM106972_088040 [Dulcicalothrix desertica PCC 7102]TWH40413.1 putative GH25 family protein [Dulcicalothrix desertica PCC 7102]
MLINRLKELLLAVAFLPLMMQAASAHVIWYDYQNGEYKVLYGHPEEGPIAYDTTRFKEAVAYDSQRQTIPFTINRQPDGVSLTSTGNVAALTGFLDNGFVADVAGNRYSRISESEVAQNKDVRHLLKYTKALYDWSPALAESFNQPLEILPLQNPLEVKAGDNLNVRVLYQGKPASDANLEYLGQVVPIGQDGIFSIPIGVGGLQQVEAQYESLINPDFKISYEASFTAQKTSIPESSALLGIGVFGLLALNRKKMFGAKA